MNKRKVIIFGARGLLGTQLRQVFSNDEVFAWDREDLDITDRESVLEQCKTVDPDIIINAAAYTAVDQIETDAEVSRNAFLVNAHAVYRLAEVALTHKALFVHFSTDYVFDGEKGEAYEEEDDANPINAYGRSKREGEEMVLRLSERDLKYYLIRTSRLFGKAKSEENSKETFPDLVLRLAMEKKSLDFIEGSEISSTTYANDLAAETYKLVASDLPYGIYHRTNDGECSWFEFAKEVLNLSPLYTTEEGVKDKQFVEVTPVAASSLPRPAKRPKYSVLKSTKLPPMRSWKEALADYLTLDNDINV